ncbi:MAG TPA: hypothetical protein VN549_02610 [Negativicutes bacterium]|nr:hypothetical protein [Negativicutes bacterium]
MKLVDLRDLLSTVGVPVDHYKASKRSDKYIVWSEDGQVGGMHADDSMTEQVLQGTIDYFTKEEFDPNFEIIQKKLNSADITWGLNSVQYEENTKYIHYEWVWEVDSSIG